MVMISKASNNLDQYLMPLRVKHEPENNINLHFDGCLHKIILLLINLALFDAFNN